MNKKLSCLSIAIAIVLYGIMCAVIAWNYNDLLWGGKYDGYSAPPYVAYFFAIPFVVGIIIFCALAYFFNKKS